MSKTLLGMEQVRMAENIVQRKIYGVFINFGVRSLIAICGI